MGAQITTLIRKESPLLLNYEAYAAHYLSYDLVMEASRNPPVLSQNLQPS